MRVKYKTLNDKFYYINIDKYRTTISESCASKFQKRVKDFFVRLYPRDCWLQEFHCYPILGHKYRFDLFNFTRGFIVESMGDQHNNLNPWFHKTHEDFRKSIVRDREKALWAEANKLSLIEVYPHNLPLSLTWLKEKYPMIRF